MSEFHIHDTGYKYLFSHAELVQELVEGFLPTELCAMLDFTTLSLVSGSYITPAMKHKEDDAVWRVQMGDKFVYLYLLLEFQSTVDEAMPIRMMQYVASLYESLVKTKEANPKQLPAVIPIVLYNGEERWKVATDIHQLIECPSVLKPYQPSLRYLLLDEGAYDEHELLGTNNIVASVFAMENATDHHQVRHVLSHLAGAIAQHPAKERMDKALAKWAGYFLNKAHPQIQIDEKSLTSGEVSMLAVNVHKWAEGFKNEGIQQGVQQGIQQGKSSLLKSMLTMKFPNTDLTRYQLAIDDAAEDDLMRYSMRLLSARSVEEVFKD